MASSLHPLGLSPPPNDVVTQVGVLVVVLGDVPALWLFLACLTELHLTIEPVSVTVTVECSLLTEVVDRATLYYAPVPAHELSTMLLVLVHTHTCELSMPFQVPMSSRQGLPASGSSCSVRASTLDFDTPVDDPTITARDHLYFIRYSFTSLANWCTTPDTTNVSSLLDLDGCCKNPLSASSDKVRNGEAARRQVHEVDRLTLLFNIDENSQTHPWRHKELSNKPRK
ncbi:MAG: hypothetical protein BYD32DRAFT_467286 [Podila humilis]|nr:MAG: hypothetical protein BYD32DRAFT_467286 [Podila humilis]